MAKKPASLSDALMPVEEQAAIPPRVEKAELPKARIAENQNSSEPFVGLNFKVRASFRREFNSHTRGLAPRRYLFQVVW